LIVLALLVHEVFAGYWAQVEIGGRIFQQLDRDALIAHAPSKMALLRRIVIAYRALAAAPIIRRAIASRRGTTCRRPRAAACRAGLQLGTEDQGERGRPREAGGGWRPERRSAVFQPSGEDAG
jgi:hypothetical protein